jgi:hypothetical protein
MPDGGATSMQDREIDAIFSKALRDRPSFSSQSTTFCMPESLRF